MKRNLAVFLAGCLGIVLFLIGPIGMEKTRTASDFLYLALALAHLLWACATIIRQAIIRRPTGIRRPKLLKDSGAKPPEHYQGHTTRAPEVLVSVTLVLYIFSYIFATNANMDYLQRFAASSGNLRLAPDSLTERLNSLLRYCPFLVTDFSVVIAVALMKLRGKPRVTAGALIRGFALPLALVSSVLYTAAIPSFFTLEGIGFLAYFCLVPLFLVLVYAPKWWGLFYGAVFGVIQTMLTNYWLGTFSLVSLQLITLVYLFLFAVFMTVTVCFFKRFGRRALLFIPLLWVVFDYLRSLGFIGYPWGFLGVSQYKFLPLIQIASVTGVWGITLIVLSANGVLAFLAAALIDKRRETRKLLTPPALFLLLFSGVLVFGFIAISAEERRSENAPSIRIALVQQNADPRKHDYRATFEVLKEQTDRSMEFDPDLVVWSETAFVPNIRRWSEMDPARYPYARLVNQFLDYQKSLNVWLLTGNDDYELLELDNGETERHEYNAAVFFDPAGNRVETYRKIHLVPFTEYFPFKESFPGLYEWLSGRDVYLWEPGTDLVVFEHPLVRFSTPICFEDGFPSDIRAFVRAGAELIINISNDYWSLTEVEAQQHFANALFRAVENSRPMLRASASGVTCGVEPTGKVTGRLPFYEEGFLIAEVKTEATRLSAYTRLGDWLPLLSAAFLALTFTVSSIRSRPVRRKGGNGVVE